MIKSRKDDLINGASAVDAKAELQDYLNLVQAIRSEDQDAVVEAIENRKNMLLSQQRNTVPSSDNVDKKEEME